MEWGNSLSSERKTTGLPQNLQYRTEETHIEIKEIEQKPLNEKHMRIAGKDLSVVWKTTFGEDRTFHIDW